MARKSQNHVNEADYVVVGAGSAGCAVAGRLAEAGKSVVLIEAGGPGTSIMFTKPGMITVIHSDPKLKARFDWGFYNAPQKNLLNRKIPATRGKIVGGSSNVNGMIFVRGSRANFDQWAAEGATGWSYEDVLPTYKKLETWERGANDYRGGAGPVKVQVSGFPTEASEQFVRAGAEALGLPINDDYNGAEQEGMHLIQENIRNGRRFSSREAYLARELPTLSTQINAQVTRIVIENGRATGVEIAEPGQGRRVIKAGKEVIISGGAFGSPHILMLSGIGRADHLTNHGIKVVADLPVGDNLHDHLFVPMNFLMDSARNKSTARYMGAQFAKEMLRPGTTTMAHSTFECGAFFKTPYADSDAADMQFLGLPWAYPAPNQDVPSRLSPDKRKMLSMFSTLIQPKSRGTVRLASANPLDAPVIDPNFLDHSGDLDVLVAGLEMIREVFAHPSIAKHVKAEVEFGPQFKGQALRDEVLNRATTVYHPVGSVKMGTDETAVVDTELKVRGVEGLRVADASIMPTIISGNTNAPSIMIGERCAEFILKG